MAADGDAVGGAYGSSNERVATYCRVLQEWGENVYLGKMYICLVYTWWMSFETTPVTGSLVSVADNLCTAEFDTLFQDIVDCLTLELGRISDLYGHVRPQTPHYLP